MERCHKRDESIETLYMKTEFLIKPRITPILEGKYRMQGPTDECHNLSSSEEPLGLKNSNNPLKEEEHGLEDQYNETGYINQDSKISIKEAFVTCNDKQNVNEEVKALGASVPEENDEVLSFSRKVETATCFDKDVSERTEEKTKGSSRRGRSKRKFFQANTDKDVGTSETDKCSTDLSVRSSVQEVPSSNLLIELCSNEDQKLHIGKSASLPDGGTKAGFGPSHVFKKKSPRDEHLEVNKPVLNSLPTSKSKNCGTCNTTSSNDLMKTYITPDDTKLPSQILLEACSLGLRDVPTESRPINDVKTDEDTRRQDIIDLERDKALHECCKNCSSAANLGALILESTGRATLCDHVQDSVRLGFPDSGDFGRDNATVKICCTYTKEKRNFLDYKEACSLEGCKENVVSLYEQSTHIDESKVTAEGRTDVLQIHPNQGNRQAVKYLDATSDKAVTDDFNEVLPKNESCSTTSKENETLLSVEGTMPFYHPLDKIMLSSQDGTCSAHLEVYLDNPTPSDLDENTLMLQSSDNRPTKVLKVPSVCPLKLISETHAVQLGKECMDKMEEERVSKAMVKPLEGTSMSATFLKQDRLTLNENKGTPPFTQPEEDVKVCDICGDAGYEDLLAVCSACNEGAEHIYCMRTRLMTLPEGNWHCETCKGKREVGDSSKLPCAEVPTLREASVSEISFRKKASEKKHFLLSTQKKREASDSKGAMLVCNSVPEGNDLGNFGVGAVGISSSNKQIIENADYMQLASSQAQAQDCTLKGQKSAKIISTVHSQLPTLTPSIRLSALKRQDSQTNNSKAKSSTQGLSPVLNTNKSTKRKLLASTPSTDVVVPSFKRQTLENNDNKLADVPTLLQPVKTSESYLRVSETSEEKLLPPAIQGKRPVGGPASGSGVHSKGKLEINTSLSKPADPKTSAHVKDVTITSLPVKLENAIQEKKCTPLEVQGLPLPSKDNSDVTIDLTDIKSSRNQPDVSTVSEGAMFSRTKPISATYSKEAIADGNVQVPPGESRKVSQELPSLPSSSRLRTLFPSHAVGPGNNSIVSRAISSTIPTRCYRCKETGHIAKDCIRSSSNHAPDFWPSFSWTATSLQNETVRKPPGLEKGNVLCGSSMRQSSYNEPFSGDLARPQHTILWQGGFEIVVEGQSLFYDGIQAHPSTKAVKEVYEATQKLPSRVSLEEVQANFVPNLPDGGLIALYFKAANAESAGRYVKLLEHMTKDDLALRGQTSTAELLVFTSNRLPQIEQCWNQEKFLWGLFRKRKLSTPRSVSTLNSWNCQRSIPVTSSFTRENNEISSNFTPTISLEQKCSAQIEETDTLAAKKLDAADRVVNMFEVDHKKSFLPSSRMTAFPYIQEFKPALHSEQQSALSRGFSEEKKSNSSIKGGPILPDDFATAPLNCTWKSPENIRTELGSTSILPLPDFQTSAGTSNEKSDSTRQRNWLKNNYLSGAEKAAEQELEVSNFGFGLRSVLPLSKRQTNKSFLLHQLPSAFPHRLENEMWDDARLYVPDSSTPRNIRAEGQLRAPYVESNFGVEDKEVNPEFFTGAGNAKASTIVQTAGEVLNQTLRTRNDKVLKELRNPQEDLQKQLDKHEHVQLTSQSLEHSLSHSGSQSHSSSHSHSEACSSYEYSRSSSAFLPQGGPGNHSQQQIFNTFKPSVSSDFGQATKSIHLTGMKVGGKTLAKEPPKSISNTQLNSIEELYMRFINEKTMHGDAYKDIIFCGEGDILLRAQALHSQPSNVNSSAAKLDSRLDMKEGNYEIDSAESSISSGEPFNEQKLAFDAMPRIGHSSISNPTSSSLIQGDTVINTGQIRETLKQHNNVTAHADPHPSANRVPLMQSEDGACLNLELALGGKCSNPHQERHSLEKLAVFESKENCIASKSKWIHADYKKCNLPDPESDSKHCNAPRPKDQLLSLTLAVPSQRQEPVLSGAFEDQTLLDNAECALQLFK